MSSVILHDIAGVTPDEIKATRLRLGLSEEGVARLIGADARAWRLYELGQLRMVEPSQRLLILAAELPVVRRALELMVEEVGRDRA